MGAAKITKNQNILFSQLLCGNPFLESVIRHSKSVIIASYGKMQYAFDLTVYLDAIYSVNT